MAEITNIAHVAESNGRGGVDLLEPVSAGTGLRLDFTRAAIRAPGPLLQRVGLKQLVIEIYGLLNHGT